MRQLLKSMLLMVGLIASMGFADQFSKQPSLSSSNPALSAKTIVTQNSTDFLPVAQAFQVVASIDQEQLVFDWSIAKGYYLYLHGFKIHALEASTQLGPTQFEAGKRKWDEFFEAELEVYYGQTRLKVPFSASNQNFDLQLESQGCADAGLCYPPYRQWLSVDLASGVVDISTVAANPLSTESSTAAPSTSLWSILLLALAGGVILNLMPCVFPVLSIKVLSFTRSHRTEGEKRLHGLAYTSGVVASFLAIAALMLLLRASGEAIGWGFQLQSPGFVIFLIYLFSAIGLSLSGYLEIGSGLMALGQSSKVSNSLSSSFMTGVLAATVASPCTAPFMGPALGFAIAQPSYLALLVFAFLGLGMALPFIVLSWVPGLTNKLPKPGQWMDSLKQFLAFPMYLTAIWLLWVAGRQTSVNVVIAIIAGLLLMTMAIWLWKLKPSESSSQITSKVIKVVAVGLMAGAIVLPGLGLKTPDHSQRWEAYTPQRLAELRNTGKPVFINLTADWCITCLVNESIAFGDKFYQRLKAEDITYLKGDWTNNDPQITQLLNQYNRSGVPLYLLYPRGQGSPQILPQILLESSLLEALNRAK